MLVAKCKTSRLLNFAFCRPASKERLQLKRIGYVSLFMTLTKKMSSKIGLHRATHTVYTAYTAHAHTVSTV